MTGAALVSDTLLHLAVALDGAGRHTRADAESHPAYWAALARTAERGLLDLVTIGGTRPADAEHPDAALLAAYLAPLTRHVGLVPVLSAEPTAARRRHARPPRPVLARPRRMAAVGRGRTGRGGPGGAPALGRSGRCTARGARRRRGPRAVGRPAAAGGAPARPGRRRGAPRTSRSPPVSGTSCSSPRATPRTPRGRSTRSAPPRRPSAGPGRGCGWSPTSRSHSTARGRRRPWPARPPSWPTCSCRCGPRVSTGPGCDPRPCRATCSRSSTAWCPRCSATACSARPTGRRRCAPGWGWARATDQVGTAAPDTVAV